MRFWKWLEETLLPKVFSYKIVRRAFVKIIEKATIPMGITLIVAAIVAYILSWWIVTIPVYENMTQQEFDIQAEAVIEAHKFACEDFEGQWVPFVGCSKTYEVNTDWYVEPIQTNAHRIWRPWLEVFMAIAVSCSFAGVFAFFSGLHDRRNIVQSW